MHIADHDAIVREFMDYLVAFIEQPRPELGDLPVCPFARKARLEGRIRVEVVDLSLDAILPRLAIFEAEPRLHVVIFAHGRKEGPSSPDVYRIAGTLNRTLPGRNLLAMTGHPDDPFNIDGLYTRSDPYPNVQVIRYDVGDEASRSLKHSRYYERWTEQNFRDLVPMERAGEPAPSTGAMPLRPPGRRA